MTLHSPSCPCQKPGSASWHYFFNDPCIQFISKRSESESHSVVSNSLRPHGLYSPCNSPGQDPGVGSLSPPQGIFPTQGSNSGLLHCRQILYQLSHKGSPRILEWVAYPFSSGSSQARDRTQVSCIVGRFFTNWAISLPKTMTTLLISCTPIGNKMFKNK